MVCFATSIFRGFLRSGNKKRASRPYIFIHYSAIGERVNENILSYESVSYLCEPAQHIQYIRVFKRFMIKPGLFHHTLKLLK